MEKQKNTPLLQQIQQTETSRLLDVISELREEGTDQVLEILTQLYIDRNDEELHVAIAKFFADLKNQSSAPIIVDLINNQKFAMAKQMLVSSCWQTRLNYILYLETFIDLVLLEPFEIAFEAFTVIENLESRVSDARKNELIRFIESRLDNCRDENQVLADDLAAIVRQYEE